MFFKPLKKIYTKKNRARRAGFELEFAGINPSDAANIVASIYDGVVEEKSRFAFTCKTKLGIFDIAFDARALTDLKHRKILKDIGIDLEKIDENEILESLMERGASLFVPCEITTPPMNFNSFKTLNNLTSALVKNGAKGTSENIHYAFGLHINLEMVDLEMHTILDYLQAFLLLEPYLKEISQIDLTRRLSSYIDPFPEAYVRQVLNLNYKPTSIETLMRDYFTFNPTRNRALDLMPIFGMIDETTTKAFMNEPELLKPRPALHYRLPNCSLGEHGWSIATEWNRFMLVENLANDNINKNRLIASFQNIESEYFFGKKGKRMEAIREWASDHTSE